MTRSFTVHCLSCLLVLGASAAAAQDAAEGDFDYDAAIEDLPIESEAYGSATTFTNQSGGEVNFYGQLNLAYQSFNDGDETTSGIVDNGNWNTRLGFTITQPLENSTIRYRFETGLGLRNSAAISQEFEPDWIDWQRTSLRWFEAAFDTEYGTLSLGQGSTASDGTAGLDDSFTFHAGATDSSDGFGSFRFRDGNGDLTDVTVGQVNNSFDGARRFRIRYDTPVYEGVMLSTSYGQNILTSGDDTDYYDVAIRWTGDLGDFSVRSAVGYQWLDDPNGENTRRLAGSVSVVHAPTGLNFAFSAGEQIDGANYIWTRLGWQTNYFAMGRTNLSVDYYNGNDFLSDGAKTENYGIYAVQTIDAASVDVYAGWRRFTYSDQLGGSYQDAEGILVGARFFF
ncbi:MAG: porin [Gemmobacter sp.]